MCPWPVKTSCLVPVPGGRRPAEMKDHRPVALTSVLMKTFMRLLLWRLKPQVEGTLDPLQFAYQGIMGGEDAVLYMVHRAFSFLDGAGGYVRVMFFSFHKCLWYRTASVAEGEALLRCRLCLLLHLFIFSIKTHDWVSYTNSAKGEKVCWVFLETVQNSSPRWHFCQSLNHFSSKKRSTDSKF